MIRGMSLAEVSELPAVTDLVTAGRAFGLGRTKAYELARAGEFPCPVIRAGATWLVPTPGLLAALGLPLPTQPDDNKRKAGTADGRGHHI
ncbi:MAG: DNA-binding protein [Streptosporangiaceae bacterium]